LGSAALVLAALAGCGGGNDTPAPVVPVTPPPVTPPPTTPPVEVPTGTSPIMLSASTPAATFAALAPKVKVGLITIASPPVVHFSLTDGDGNAIIGFGSASTGDGRGNQFAAPVKQYPNIAFSLAKLVPGANSGPSKWVSYMVTTVPTTAATTVAPTRPSTDNTGTLVDNGNGTYSYTFYRDVTKVKDVVAAATVSAPNVLADLGDLTYDANLTHRLTIAISGNAPGTGTNTADGVQVTPAVPMRNPLNVITDFIPATGKLVTATDTQRQIADKASCNECHGKLGGIPGTESASFHGGGRYDPQYCTVCHTDQRKYGRTNTVSTNLAFPVGSTTYVADGATVGDLPVLIHKLHLGAELAKQNYDFAGVKLNETKYPQDVRNCTKCHSGADTAPHKTLQGDNWKNLPNRLACGACHDGINFATGKGVTLADAAKGLPTSTFGHVGGAQADDSLCAICHTPATIPVSHVPVTPPNPDNSLLVVGGNNNTAAAWIAGNQKNLPEGAIKVSYDIQSVSRDSATGRPVMVFKMLQDGVAVPFNDKATKFQIWDNFVGSPSVYFVFAVPQDGIAAPADFNASVSGYIRTLWNGTASGAGAGTLVGPDAQGYYTATLTGVTIPANAVMLTGGVGYTYGLLTTQPLTQINLAAYPVKPSPVAVPPVGQPTLLTGGLIVAAQDVVKVATGYTGRHAVVQDGKCDACHEQLGIFTAESFHAGQRNDGPTCSWCHTPNRTSSGWSADSTYFVHAIHGASKRTVPFTWHAAKVGESFANVGYPGILSNCETCHLPGTYDFSASDSSSALPNRLYRTVGTGKYNGTGPVTAATFALSPYVVKDNVTDYGAGFAFNAVNGATTVAAATTLVNSPIAAVCFACHDSSTATLHMQQNGGAIYAPRGVALANGPTETCMLCHATGKVADIKVMHSK
jgi:OmcA/MtrC family decaheme c-type cytochrome